MAFLTQPDVWFALISLTVLELILGIDNLVILAILSSHLPDTLAKRARRTGLLFAWVFRLLLLSLAVHLTRLTSPLFKLGSLVVSGRDVLFFFGGLLLLIKALQELWALVNSVDKQQHAAFEIFSLVIAQIIFFDLIFSLDSIMTAVAITQHYSIMAIAITMTIAAMLLASEPLCGFIEKYPRVKILALSFILLIGLLLVAEGFHYHIPRSYLYLTMAFAAFVEFICSWSEAAARRRP